MRAFLTGAIMPIDPARLDEDMGLAMFQFLEHFRLSIDTALSEYMVATKGMRESHTKGQITYYKHQLATIKFLQAQCGEAVRRRQNDRGSAIQLPWADYSGGRDIEIGERDEQRGFDW
jgi:hypothetical protein